MPRRYGTSARPQSVHTGMSYARLEELKGIQWPCYDENHPGELFLHSRLGAAAQWSASVVFSGGTRSTVERLSANFAAPHDWRRLDEYNTGVQTSGYRSPLRRGETLDLSPEDAERLGAGMENLLKYCRGEAPLLFRCAATNRCGPTYVHDVALRRCRHESFDDRSPGPEIGNAEFKAPRFASRRCKV